MTGLYAFGLVAALSFATWLVSLWRRDVSIVDGMWPVFIASAGILYAVDAPRLTTFAVGAFALLAIWAVRLCLHITVRNHGQPEDRRYQKIRANNQPHFEFKSLYIVFGFQAVLAWIVAVPFMAITHNAREPGVLEVLGTLLAAFGTMFEAVADWQLERFKKNPASRGLVLDTGLWRYSQSIDRLFEALMWCAYAAFGVVALGRYALFARFGF